MTMLLDALLPDEDRAFRAEVRAFVREHLPADVAARGLQGFPFRRDDCLWWTRVLARRGWSVPTWPVEYGGPGWSVPRQHLFEEECHLAGAPPLGWQGLRLAGPLIYTFGTPEQKARFLPPIVNGEYLWAQGFSEPNAGSDLASLRTSARRVGDVYVVDGQKIWTSEAHVSEWLFCLVRTSTTVKPQLGITMLLVPLGAPGVRIRPIRSIDGCHTLNEVFFDGVEVPVDLRVGVEGEGWLQAKFVLGLERAGAAEIPRLKRGLARLKVLAAERTRGDHDAHAAASLMLRIAQIEIDLIALQVTTWRAIADDTARPAQPVPMASILKVRGAELLQRIGELSLELLGPAGIEFHPEPNGTRADWPTPAGVAADLLYRRAATIYGGSNDIQRNLIARAVLGD